MDMKNARNILQNIKFSNTIIGIQGLALHSNNSILNSVLPEMDFDGLFLCSLRVSQTKVRPKGLYQRHLCTRKALESLVSCIDVKFFWL